MSTPRTSITPTLIIGLGGTGRQTLMQVRRQFLEDDPYIVPQAEDEREAYRRTYRPGHVPHVELLSIDTDDRLLDLEGERYDDVLAAAALGGAEILDLKIDAERAGRLYREPNAHPNYRDWYDFSLAKFPPPEHGCGQTRPWGRLAFFHNESAIRARIKSAMERLLSPDTRAAASRLDLNLDTGLIKVQLVFSVAGGTGSGMCLDTAFLVRRIVGELQGVNLVLESVILMPDAFSNNPKHRVFANGYAALMEIEYYNQERDGTDAKGWFPLLWESEYSGREAPKRLIGPTFHLSWLIGSMSRGVSATRTGTRLSGARGEKRALTSMIAGWLYRRCSPVGTAFGGNINAFIISNALQLEGTHSARTEDYVGDALVAREGAFEFSRRFGSFGLTKIHAPSSLTHERLAHRLVRDIVGDWLEDAPRDSGALASETGRARQLLHLDSKLAPVDADHRPMDMQVFALARSIEDSAAGQSVLDVVKREIEADRRRISGDERGEDFERSFTDWAQRFREQRISDSDPADARKGEFARNIIGFAATRGREDTAMLDTLIGEYLRQQGRGIGFAREVLRTIANDYERVVKNAPGAVETEKEASQDFATAAEDRLAFYGGSRFVRDTVARVCFNKQRDALLAEAGRQIYGKTGELAATMATQVAAKLRELDELERELRDLAQDVDRVSTQLEERPHSNLDVLIAGDGADHYVSDGKSLDLATTRWGLLPASPTPEGIWQRRKSLKGAARAVFRGEFIEFAKTRLDGVLRNRTDALLQFDQKHTSDADYQAALRPLTDSATAWIDVRHDGPDRGWQAQQPMRVNRTVMRAGNEVARARLERQLVALGFRENAEKMELISGPIDELAFEEHLTGVPLFEIASLRGYRDNSYEPIMAGDAQGGGTHANAALHLERDTDKYGDLLRPDTAEARRAAEAMELFVKAVIFGVLAGKPHPQAGTVIFSYLKDHGLRKREVELGEHPRVLRTFAREGSVDAAEVRRDIETEEARIWKESNTRRAEVLALLLYYSDGKHPLQSNRQFHHVIGDLEKTYSKRVNQDVADMAVHDLAPSYASWSDEVVAGSGFRRLRP